MEIDNVIRLIGNSEVLGEWTGHGWCRKWTGLALDLLEEMEGVFDLVEAVEVEIGPRYWHSFALAKTKEGEVYFFDGVGYHNNAPYFGKAVDAPDYLKPYRRDSLLMSKRDN